MTSLLLSLLHVLLFSAASAAPRPVDVGVILDRSSPVGQTCYVSINMAVSDFYSAHPNTTTKLRLHFRDSDAADVISSASAAVDLIANDRAVAILGPQTSSAASFVADIGAECHVPVISFSATSASVSHSQSRYFVRAAVNDSAAAAPIAAVVQYYGWRRVVPIYEDSDFGSSFVPSLVDALDAVGTQVPYRVSIPVSATDDRILKELYRLKTMQTRVFVVHATSALASRIFSSANKAEMMDEGFAWIVTDGVTSSIGTIDQSVVLDAMQGVLGVKPCMPRSERLAEFKQRWRGEFLRENPRSRIVDVSTFGVWAYDAVFALATAAEAAGPINSGPKMNQSSSETDLSRLPVSQNGESLLNSLLSTEFVGLAGRFRLTNGELGVSAFQVVNFGKGRAVGFWSPMLGLTRRLNRSTKWTGKAELGTVIWPGDVTEVPKGFVQPTSGRVMKIVVPGPVKEGFQSFLKVVMDPNTNKTVASGYVIEVFEAAVRRLPYALTFEYEMKKKGSTYNQLVEQVPSVYDAFIGDVTITANRSNYVDFTMPYAVSGIAMVVPLKDERRGNAWIFLKPLEADLWIASGLFFIFTGLVVWVLEHRINDEFRGPPSHQAGTVFYFTFSTMVFSHKEAIVSNLARVVVIVWVFVVLILQTSYTANLTTMLTVRQLQPTVDNIYELMKTNENVGYLNSSYVRGVLVGMGFDEHRLKSYGSPQEYADALAKGSKKDGVGAIVDEIPYLKVFLKDYCSNYTMSANPNKTGGFAFVFPKGSPIVPDLSRAILNLTESDEMGEIERRWFGDPSACDDEGNPFTSKPLDFLNFWGLFLITGAASALCLIINVVSFLYKNRRHLDNIAADDGSLKGRVQSVARLYDQKDMTSHTFRRGSAVRRRSMTGSRGQDASPSLDNISVGDPIAPSPVVDVNLDSPMSTSHHHTFEDVSVSVELPSPPVAETPPHSHIELTTSESS